MLRLIGIIIFTTCLCACGFHLRKVTPLPSQFSSIYLQSKNPNEQFIQVLRRLLHANHAKVLNEKANAQAVIHILDIHQKQVLNSLTGSAEAGLYSISTSVSFMATTQKGKILLPKTTISAKRYFNSNATQVLSAQSKSQQLANEMRLQLAQELLNQINASS